MEVQVCNMAAAALRSGRDKGSLSGTGVWVFDSCMQVFALWQVARFWPALTLRMMKHFTVSYPGVFQHKRLHTLLTSGISHIGLIHFLCNHYTLHSFGLVCSTILGPAHFLAMYAAGAIGSSLG